MGLVAKAFQDIITFSRASSGTYVNSNGYITNSSVLNYLTYSNQPENAAWTKSNSFVQQNLLLYSEDFTNAAWLKQNITVTADSTISPFGTLTADTITAAGGLISLIAQSAGTTVASSPYAQSIYAKAGSKTVIQADFNAAGWGTDLRANFDLANGVLGTVDAGITATIENLGNGWYRCSAARTKTPTTGNLIWCMVDSTTSAREAVCTAGTLYIFGAQLVQGSVPGDYRATTSAALPVLYADYNGALRARKLCENTTNTAHAVLQTTATIIAGSQQTFSIYLRSGERTKGRMFCCNGAGSSGFQCDFDLVAGTATAGANVGTGAITGTPTISNLGGGNYRVWMTGIIDTASTTGGGYVYLRDAAGAASYTGDGSSGIYIADAQLNDGSSALSYYDTTAYAYNAPRFDYDPATLAAKGLLVEESRANLLLQSNDFQTSWGVTNITRTLNSILSPSGNIDGVKIAATAAAATTVLQAATVAATSATGSVYVKQGTGATVANSFVLKNGTTGTNLVAGTLNYSTGVFTYSIGSTGVVVTPLANGWWRIAISATTGITSGDSIQWFVGWGGAIATAGDFLYAYGAQLEAGAFATSYIPTVASQVTRAADVASVNTLSPWFNQAGGTIYVEALHGAIPSAAALAVEIGDGTNDNRHAIFTAGSANASYYVFVGGVAQATVAATAFAANAVGKFAAAYAVNDFQTVGNGTLGSSDASGSLPTNLNKMFIGNNIGSTSFWNGWLRRITYYPRRLTNAELQSITTL